MALGKIEATLGAALAKLLAKKVGSRGGSQSAGGGAEKVGELAPYSFHERVEWEWLRVPDRLAHLLGGCVLCRPGRPAACLTSARLLHAFQGLGFRVEPSECKAPAHASGFRV